MGNKLTELAIAELTLPNLKGEGDVIEDALQGNVLGLDPAKSFIKCIANIFIRFVYEKLEAGLWWDPKVSLRPFQTVFLPLQRPAQVTFYRQCALWKTSMHAFLKTSEHRFRNNIPKMYSLNSEASILPQRI